MELVIFSVSARQFEIMEGHAEVEDLFGGIVREVTRVV